ncbi:MAG: glycosyltransferase family 9 protein, partial [Planctomycetales bacterium]|nr:glycosyltransferase family 9 protein [Planctomycetales bacterium]
AQRRIGFARPQGRELAPWLATDRVVPRKTHAVDRFLELLAPLGIEKARAEFRLADPPAAREAAQRFLQHAGVNGPLAVMHPGAGWDSKLWPAERFAEVAAYLGERHGMTTVVAWSGARVKAWAKEIAGASGGRAITAPQTTLPELIALLRAATLYVGSDSGPLHMAAAVGTATVSLFGPSTPEANGPYGAGHVMLQAYYQSGSRRQRQFADNHAMRAISSHAVMKACDEILSGAGRQRREQAA